MEFRGQTVDLPKSAAASQANTGGRDVRRWRLGTKIAFRFAFVYFPLYTLYIPVHFLAVPPIPQLYKQYGALWHVVIMWVGEGWLHLQLETGLHPEAVGSRDTMFNWVQLLCYIIFAAVVAVVWSVLDRKRPNYEQLEKWFWLYLRLVLGVTMIQYGAAKIFPWQFPPPTLNTLLEPYGDSSPWHLLWTFMGASRSYSWFGGISEILGGMLLMVPRLTTLGALVSLGVVSNVLMLNLSYDVSVKIFTIHLLLMSMLLLLPDLKRLANFFVFNRPIEPAPVRPLFRQKWLNQTAIGLQLVFGVALLALNLYHDRQAAQEIIDSRIHAPLYGIWTVDEFTRDGQVLAPLLTDPIRWQRVIIEGRDKATVQPMNGDPRPLILRTDTGTRSLSMTGPKDWGSSADFKYENFPPDRLVLRGKMDGHPVTITLHRVDESRFLLTNRGFHWVNEYALDR